MHQDYQSKTVDVYGDKFAREKNPVPAYQRELRTRPVTFTCIVCKQEVRVKRKRDAPRQRRERMVD